MKDQAQVVIVGGGIVGANVAYHLAKLGWTDVSLFDHVGSLRVASSPDQFKELQRSVSRAKAIGMDVEVISPSEALKVMPQLSPDNLYGAIYLPRDGPLDPYTTTTSMVRFAKEMGVTIY